MNQPIRHRWRYHLSALILLLPLVFIPVFMHEELDEAGQLGLGAHPLPPQGIGPWRARLFEKESAAPAAHNAPHKTFVLNVCATCAPQIRAAYLHLGAQPSTTTPGALFKGSLYHSEVALPVPASAKPAALWLTLEGWDGRSYQAQWPLAHTSPAFQRWMQSGG